MPQLNKGGKFVFGLSVIHENRSVQIPPQAINEYRLSNENKIIIFTGSKITGGFCVTFQPANIHYHGLWKNLPGLLAYTVSKFTL